MFGRMKKTGLCAAAITMLCASVPAQAAMNCWNDTQVAAAKVRDLQSRLMVATLRCQAMGEDVTGAYNRFVAANRTTIQNANGVILAAFRDGHGGQAQLHYDRFATALANLYGDDTTDREVCAETAAAAEEAAAAAGDIRQLVTIAHRLGDTPDLPGGQCSISFASAQVEAGL